MLPPVWKSVAGQSDFTALSAVVAAERPRLAEQRRALDGRYHEAIGRDGELRRTTEAIAAELASLEQRTSNLPAEQVEIRAELCAALGLTPEDLPYAGELLDVHDEHSQWRGAAERVLRGFALSLLVPQQHYDSVTGWVNGRRLTVAGRGGRQVGARLVYERVARQRFGSSPPNPETEHCSSPTASTSRTARSVII